MKNRTPITLFPFLSVLVSTMGVLSLLAVTFSMFSGPDSQGAGQRAKRQAVNVRWVGAPAYVRPLLVECQAGGAMVHGGGGRGSRFFPLADLKREGKIVRAMEDQGVGRMGLVANRQTLWLYFKSAIENEPSLRGSLTLLVHQTEISNLTGENHLSREEHYPILLVYPDGISAYELVSYLVDTTTHLAVGVEPMMAGWTVPFPLSTR